MKATLTKLSDNVNKLRTNSISGDTLTLPMPGVSFQIIGDALEEPFKTLGGGRVVTTSPVKEVVKEENGSYTFTTLNSTYKLKVEGDVPVNKEVTKFQ